MAITHVSKEEIQKIRQNLKAKKTETKQKIEKQPDYISQIKDEDLAKIFADFGYISHDRSRGCIHVDFADFDIYFNDYTLVSARKSKNQIELQNKNVNDSEHFDYLQFERYCETMGITAEKAIYEYLYDKILKNLPYYVDSKVRFDRNMVDSVDLVSGKTLYNKLIKPAINKNYEIVELNDIKHKYGTTDPKKISEILTNL